MTDEVCINIGRVAHAINTRQIASSVEEFGIDRAMKTQWPVRSYNCLYPEELCSDKNERFQTVWPLFSYTPLILLKDRSRQRWLLDGGLRLRMAAHSGAKSVKVCIVDLSDALKAGDADIEAGNINSFGDLPGQPIVWPAGATLPEKGALAALALESWIEPKDNSLESLDDYFLVLFAIYFEKFAVAQGATYGKNYQEKMRETYDALSYKGVPILKRFSFDAMYRNRKADALRRVFRIGPEEKLPNTAFHIRGETDPNSLLRLIYALGLVSVQVEHFNALLSRLSPKKRDPLLIDRFMEETRQREVRRIEQLKSGGVLPINIVDFLHIAQVTGVNSAYYYPNRQRMRGVLDWMCAWHAQMSGHDLVTPLMRAQFARRTFILRNGGDAHTLDWEMLVRYRSEESNMYLMASCWREMFACDPDLLKASKIDEILGNLLPG